MSQQTPDDVDALWNRLTAVFDDTPRTTVVETPEGRAGWKRTPRSHDFGTDIPDVKSIVVHVTGGWPVRDKWRMFAERFTDSSTGDVHGVGPHFYVPHDGTVFRLLSETLICHHAGHVNEWAIGVETGNLTLVAPPDADSSHDWPDWTRLSRRAQDVPGAKFYACADSGEVLISLWTVNNEGAPTDSRATRDVMMLFSEAQYRTWALLARWLAERWRVPRDFPLRPHLKRSRTVHSWRAFRAVIDAHPMREVHIRTQLEPNSCPMDVYESDDPDTGLPHVYEAGVRTVTWEDDDDDHREKEINERWTDLFDSYRGFHGHGFSGSNVRDDHNCPGPWFDWHRFAREVWDYWWYPFDLAQPETGGPIVSGQPRRLYGFGDGVLYEHYFDEDASLFRQVTPTGFFPVGDETVAPHPSSGSGAGSEPLLRGTERYWGFWHGGMHFQLDAGSPIYATAAGQLVAARLHRADAVEDPHQRHEATSPFPSSLFVLLRHEVFHRPASGGARIDYTQEPAFVYSLTMHLGVPAELNFQRVVAGNPTWLNRAITMKLEYDLGLAFHERHPEPADAWLPHTTRWNRRQPVIDQALSDLEAGRVARFPEGEDAIRVALGDFLGVAGHLDQRLFGIHLEVFSREAIEDSRFEQVDQGSSAGRPYHDEANLDDVSEFLGSHVAAAASAAEAAGRFRAMPPAQKAGLFQGIALRSKSEWALAESDFPAGGWASAQALMWWPDVVPGMNAGAAEPARLPDDAVVWHYHPLGFMAWLNGVTWRSEWPKYRITDASGAAVDAPESPPPRR